MAPGKAIARSTVDPAAAPIAANTAAMCSVTAANSMMLPLRWPEGIGPCGLTSKVSSLVIFTGVFSARRRRAV